MIKIDSTTTLNNTNTRKRAAILAGTGAVIGGGATYFLQKRAIAKDKAAKEAIANRNIFQKTFGFITGGIGKVWNSVKSLGGKIKTSYKEGMENVVKTGKISKMGIVKGAAIAAIALPVIDFVRKNQSKKINEISTKETEPATTIE